MGIFKRLFKVGEAEVHSALDKLEDPIRMTEQGIRDMKKDLDASLKALAEVKAMVIRTRNDVQTHKAKAAEYEAKAIALLKKAQTGDLNATDADRLAEESLAKKESYSNDMNNAQIDQKKFETNVSQLDGKIKKLKSDISSYENELRTLKARVKVSEATAKVNKQMAGIDSSSTVSMLERMKERVEQQEALAEAYGDVANEDTTLDSEIDSALGGAGDVKAADDLAALKSKLGMDK